MGRGFTSTSMRNTTSRQLRHAGPLYDKTRETIGRYEMKPRNTRKERGHRPQGGAAYQLQLLTRRGARTLCDLSSTSNPSILATFWWRVHSRRERLVQNTAGLPLHCRRHDIGFRGCIVLEK